MITGEKLPTSHARLDPSERRARRAGRPPQQFVCRRKIPVLLDVTQAPELIECVVVEILGLSFGVQRNR